jgi:hypothetical protein
LTGNSVFGISKQLRRGSSSFAVEWGTSYSRAADSISGGGVVTARCNALGACAAIFEIPSGTVAYYRLQEHDAGGQTVSGPVVVRAALGRRY